MEYLKFGGTEIWRPIYFQYPEEIPDTFRVSSYGRVRNETKDTILKHGFANNGMQHTVTFNRFERRIVARLVLEAFQESNDRSHAAAHKDGDRDNLHISNLYWKKLGLAIAEGLEANGRNKFSTEDVYEIRRRGVTESQSTLAIEFKTCSSTISKIVTGNRYRRVPGIVRSPDRSGQFTITALRKLNLIEQDIVDIRFAYHEGAEVKALARIYSISVQSVQRIARGETYRNIGGPLLRKKKCS